MFEFAESKPGSIDILLNETDVPPVETVDTDSPVWSRRHAGFEARFRQRHSDEIAKAAFLLLSGQSSFTTGKCLMVDDL